MSNSSTKKVFAKNRFVGEVAGGVFRKRIKGSKHILRTPRAIALSVESVRQAVEFGATYIEITDTESARTYSTDVTYFQRYSFELQRGGYEKQRALVLERWNIAGGHNYPYPVTETQTVEYSSNITQAGMDQSEAVQLSFIR